MRGALGLVLVVVLGGCGGGAGAADAAPDRATDAGLGDGAADGALADVPDGEGGDGASGDGAPGDAGVEGGGDAGPECTTSTQCPAVRPICDLDACRGCERHTECAARGLGYCTAGGECLACPPGAALRCDAPDLVSCTADGGGEVVTPCAYGCSAAYRRCNDCLPAADSCSGATLTTCNADGYVASARTCALGCHPGGARCYDVDPANGLAAYLDQAATAPDVVLAAGATIDTSSGAVTSGGQSMLVPSAALAAPAGGVPLRVFVVRSLTAGAVTVSGARALAIVAADDLALDGLVVLAGHADAPGPGAMSYSTAHACQGEDAAATDPRFPGGGGGGFGDGGAHGGSAGSGPALAGGLGGAVDGDGALVPLRGGCWGGGAFSASPFAYAPGGAGGGAAQLVSRTAIRVRAHESGGACTPAGLLAGGGGGAPGVGLATSGGGGGSGGGLLLEAPVVAIAGCSQGAMPFSGLFANGGGGGCAAVGGADGDTLAGAGADCTAGGQGDGGHGASAAGFASAGLDAAASPGYGGGGGGGAGRIRVNTADGTWTLTGAATWVSPAASLGQVGRR